MVFDARTRAQELIDEVDCKARTTTAAGLVVILPPTTTVVWSYDDDRLERLESLIRAGGLPGGLVGWTELSTDYSLWVEPLLEDRENPEIWDGLLRLLAGMREDLIQRGVRASAVTRCDFRGNSLDN